MEKDILKIDSLTKYYGGVTAVNNVSFTIKEGEVLSLIGPNGAGKTTVFNCITALAHPNGGAILFLKDGVFWNMANPKWMLKPDEIAEIGITRTFQNIRLFNNLSTLDNVKIGCHARTNEHTFGPLLLRKVTKHTTESKNNVSSGHNNIYDKMKRFFSRLSYQLRQLFSYRYIKEKIKSIINLISEIIKYTINYSRFAIDEVNRAILHTNNQRVQEKEILKKSVRSIVFVGLEQMIMEVAANLSYGNQRKLEIARALASDPKLILLDEPTAGMNPKETVDLMNLIRKIRDTGITVLLIEHDMKVVMEISDRIVVLDYGKKIAEGTPSIIKNDPKVIEAYLGTD